MQAVGAARSAGPCRSARRSRSSLAASASRSAETNTPTPSRGTGAVERSPAVTISTSSTGAAGGRGQRVGDLAGLGHRQRAAPGAEAQRSGHRAPPVGGTSAASIDDRPSAVGSTTSGTASTGEVCGTSQVEQLAQQRRVLVAAGLGGELADPDGRLVQQPLHDPVHRAGDLGPLLVGEVGAALGAAGAARRRPRRRPGPAARPRSAPRRRRAARPGTPRPRRRRSPRPASAASAAGAAVGEHVAEPVDVDHVDAGQLGDVGLDVARDGQVEQDQRPAGRVAPAERRATTARVEDRLGGRGRGDHDVDRGERVGQVGVRHGARRRAARPAARPARRPGW